MTREEKIKWLANYLDIKEESILIPTDCELGNLEEYVEEYGYNEFSNSLFSIDDNVVKEKKLQDSKMWLIGNREEIIDYAIESLYHYIDFEDMIEGYEDGTYWNGEPRIDAGREAKRMIKTLKDAKLYLSDDEGKPNCINIGKGNYAIYRWFM